jgi:hypothetical protein
MRLLRTLLSFLPLLLLACTTPKITDPIYSGEYFYNFESSYFTPDGKSEEWCVNAGVMERAMLPAKDGNGRWGSSHVEVRGQLGPEGRYGGFGRCKHVLTVTELVTVSNMRGRE